MKSFCENYTRNTDLKFVQKIDWINNIKLKSKRKPLVDSHWINVVYVLTVISELFWILLKQRKMNKLVSK